MKKLFLFLLIMSMPTIAHAAYGGCAFGDCGTGSSGGSSYTDSQAQSAVGWVDGGTNVYQTTTTDNVGIGTTTPSTTLEIVKQGSSAPFMVSSVPTGDGDYLFIASDGNVGIGTINPKSKLYTGAGNITMRGTAARTLGMERGTVAGAAGFDLTISGGGATSGGTDKDGGNLILQSGQATGLGIGSVRIRAPSAGTVTGSSENVPVDRLVVTSGKTITEDVATDLFSIDVATGTSCGGMVSWETSTTDATEFQILSGITTYVVFNQAGTMQASVVENPSNEAKVLSAGTVTTTWQGDQNSTTFTLQVIHNSSLTPSAGHPRINYTVINDCYKNITIL